MFDPEPILVQGSFLNLPSRTEQTETETIMGTAHFFGYFFIAPDKKVSRRAGAESRI